MVESQKKAAAEAAMARVETGMRLGLGTGSTIRYFVEALSEKMKAGLKLSLCSTSEATTRLAESLGMIINPADQFSRLDMVIDGADEIGPGLALVKGGGGALFREKLIWEMADHCVVIADAAKAVKRLGRFALPLEIAPFAYKGTLNRISDVLAEFDIEALPQARLKDGKVWISDGGNLIYDVACQSIEAPSNLAMALKGITGLIDHGLFLDLADIAFLGTDDGVLILNP